MACSTIAGNAQEGKHYIVNREQILRYHGKTSKIDLADAKYDEHDNYEFSRAHGAIPIIDYNPRNENITADALKKRGYDRNGWPYAPCRALTRPNGFDFNCQRASFSCRRQCVSSKDPKLIEYAEVAPTGSTTMASPDMSLFDSSPAHHLSYSWHRQVSQTQGAPISS